jgi:phosphoglycerate dehydrogenase-like enzyme
VIDRPVVLVVDARGGDPPPGMQEAERLAEVRRSTDERSLADGLQEADVLFTWGAVRGWLRDAWDRAARLRWIQTASDGVDGLLFPALVEADVVVTNARGVFDDAIAEWTIGAMLAFATRILDQRDAQVRTTWLVGRTERLAGKNLLVVGPGPIGRAVARRAASLGMEVSAVGRSARDDDLFGRVRSRDELHAALAGADFVVDTMPITGDTRHTFGASAFAAMRPEARFLNVGRGATVDEPALIEALRTGRISGAALDVFEQEPLPEGSPLWEMPNVLVSPHMCGDFTGWEAAVTEQFVDNLDRFVRGAELRNRVDTVLGFGTA